LVQSLLVQQLADGMQVPPQSLKVALHWQAFATQDALLWQSPSMQQALAGMHCPLQSLKPLAHWH
jgi:hypothetical protein